MMQKLSAAEGGPGLLVQQRIIARQLLYTNARPTPFTLLKSLLILVI